MLNYHLLPDQGSSMTEQLQQSSTWKDKTNQTQVVLVLIGSLSRVQGGPPTSYNLGYNSTPVTLHL